MDRFNESNMRNPPPNIHLAYLRLLSDCFSYLRANSRDKRMADDQLFDFADALHNISELLGDYGGWCDDQKFRELYLRRYDEKWSNKGLSMIHNLKRYLGELE